jgi:hypothetical protein
LKRVIVWVDSSDSDAKYVEKRLREYLAKAGVRYTMFEAVEVMESENE